MKTARLIDIVRLSCLMPMLLLVQGPVLGEEIKVGKVMLLVKDGSDQVATGGRLYKLVGGARKHVADIAESGDPDAEVRCSASDRFEAASESYFDRPIAPMRLACSGALKFSFTRTILTAWQVDANPMVVVAIGPRVFSEYAAVLGQAGRTDAAHVANDAAIASAAKMLGDEKLDKYVARDPLQDYRLVLTTAGVDAVRSKQVAAGIKPTGLLDAETQALFAREFRPAPDPKAPITSLNDPVFKMKCVITAMNKPVYCASTQSGLELFGSTPPAGDVVKLPQFRVQK